MSAIGDPAIKDVTDASFAADVVARSATVPVVVDFWAPWCGPCRTLGPIIEREVAALGGRVELAKINVDENPQVAGRFDVRSIPAVKAFRDGREVDAFVGALPVAQIRAFLARVAPSPGASELQAGLAAARAGDRAAAVTRLAPLVDDPEVGGRAAIELAILRVGEAPAAEVEALLARVDPRGADVERAETVRAVLAFAADAQAVAAEGDAEAALAHDAGALEPRWARAGWRAARRDFAGALEDLLDLVTRKPRFRDGAPRQAMLALFALLGADSDLARDFRRRLQIVS